METEDGLSDVFAVNVPAPYLLTALITPPRRLVYLSSGMHHSGDTTLRDPQWATRPWQGSQAYSESKFHVTALMLAVARKWPQVLSNAVDPGWAATKMGGSGATDDLRLAPVTQAWLAAGDDAALVTDRCFHHQQPCPPHHATQSPEVQDRLLKYCAELTDTDTAAAYFNEREVGEAIARSDVDRCEIFVTTKVWIGDYGYDSALRAFEVSLRKLGIEQLDLWLLHQPLPSDFEKTIAAYKAAEKLLAEGHVRAIGVSNQTPKQLDELISHTDIVPAVNQIQVHPYYTQPEWRAANESHGILTQSWSPIGGSYVYRGADTNPLDPRHRRTRRTRPRLAQPGERRLPDPRLGTVKHLSNKPKNESTKERNDHESPAHEEAVRIRCDLSGSRRHRLGTVRVRRDRVCGCAARRQPRQDRSRIRLRHRRRP
ncbi:aldo/keto reductase [Streptomyces mirabilis]|uniref:aldo/keto reductase n=1 Tax=Streptomyces mirabilis TaxID=68239 RepID=UPI0036EBCB64